MTYNTQRPHIASYVIFRNNEGKVAFVMRSNTPWMNGHYSLPAGKVETNETYLQGAIREAKEEAGVTVSSEHLKHVLTMHRCNKGDQAPEWVDVFFEASEWEGKVVNAEPNVHSSLDWLDLNNLPDNMLPMIKTAFESIRKGESYVELGWE
jgi:ADP-ribose pyrophosphatase YjhB (NUDIX family)